jgi:glycosyltransferase involved in cell wall biosynthesis
VPKLIYFVTEDWYFHSHRLPLAQAAVKTGFEVVLLTNVQLHGDIIHSEGIRIIPIALQRHGMNPLREIKILLRIIKAYRAERPDIVHHVAMKPVLYGSMAAFLTGMPRVVNALAGMGSLFISQSLKSCILRACVKRLFRFFLNRKGSRLILQNPDDVDMFLKYAIAEKSSICLIRGAGVDAALFSPTSEPSQPITVMLSARMLFDKGIARFILVGKCDPENPAAISEQQLRIWQQERIVEWWGHQPDMPAVLAKSHVICLPSYREGLPKSLLEAASCGKPIVATDVPGCREIVRDGVNGFLVPARNGPALAEALRQLIENKDLRKQMGAKGREIVLREFAEQKVVNETLAVYTELLAQ